MYNAVYIGVNKKCYWTELIILSVYTVFSLNRTISLCAEIHVFHYNAGLPCK